MLVWNNLQNWHFYTHLVLIWRKNLVEKVNMNFWRNNWRCRKPRLIACTYTVNNFNIFLLTYGQVRHLYLWKSRCVADILRQIVLNFSPKEYESEILHVQIVHDGFEDPLQQLSPANDIVMNRDYLEPGDLLWGIVNCVWPKLW